MNRKVPLCCAESSEKIPWYIALAKGIKCNRIQGWICKCSRIKGFSSWELRPKQVQGLTNNQVRPDISGEIIQLKERLIKNIHRGCRPALNQSLERPVPQDCLCKYILRGRRYVV